jgi:hypothetical protein
MVMHRNLLRSFTADAPKWRRSGGEDLTRTAMPFGALRFGEDGCRSVAAF